MITALALIVGFYINYLFFTNSKYDMIIWTTAKKYRTYTLIFLGFIGAGVTIVMPIVGIIHMIYYIAFN